MPSENRKNSNPYGNFRDTFGLFDPQTGLRYKDVISCHLRPMWLTSEIHDQKIITDEQGAAYILHCDPLVRKELGMEGDALVMISYQRRTTGNYAMARLYRTPDCNLKN